jgi:AcrR family transcriptional regulator
MRRRGRKTFEVTASELRASFDKLKASGRRISIAEVARMSGVTPGLIHNHHADLRREISEASGRGALSPEVQRLRERVARLIRHCRKVQNDKRALQATLARETSVSEKLRRENAALRDAQAADLAPATRAWTSKVIPFPQAPPTEDS